MRGDGDAALPMNGGNRISQWQPPVHLLTNPGGDQVKGGGRDFLAGDDDHVRRADEIAEAWREDLVVIGDDDRVETAADGLALKFPSRHRTIARKGMDVQVDFKDVVGQAALSGEGT